MAEGGQPKFSPAQRPSPSRCRSGGAGVSVEGGRVGLSLNSSCRLFLSHTPVKLPSASVTGPLSAHGVWPCCSKCVGTTHKPPMFPPRRGRFSVVRQCREKASGRALAAKIVPYQPEDKTSVLREYEALKRLHHPHLAQLHAAYLSPRHLVLILELCSGPELLPCLAER